MFIKMFDLSRIPWPTRLAPPIKAKHEVEPCDRMIVDDHLLVDAKLCDHVVQEGRVDVVVQVLDRHLNFWRVSHVVLVDLTSA